MGYGVNAAFGKRVAFEKTADTQHGASEAAVKGYGLEHVF